MSDPISRDAFGFTRLYYTADQAGSTVRALLGADRTLDTVALDAHFAGGVDSSRTCFAAVRAVPPGHDLLRGTVRPWQPRVEAGDLGGALRAAVARIVHTAPRPLAVALSGGLDSAVVLALVREVEPTVTPLVLAPRFASYSEVDAALETARVAGATATVLEVTAEEFCGAVPAAIAAFEAPLYNLHPVSKWLLADRARAAGFASLISGDGADQVFTRDVSADYLPLTSAAFATAGVALATPFLDDEVIARVLAVPPDAEKRALREVGATLAIPPPLVRDRKISRLAPPMSLGIPAAKLRDLAALVGRDLPPTPDVRWETLAVLVDSFGAWR
jgi:asparagine synthase (glutamine-hydrolysing)